MKKVVHLTSAHPRYDTRIFVKECRSLAEAYELTLIVADGKGDEVKAGVRIVDVGKPKNRRARMLETTRRVFERALEIDAEVYHLHDPELLYTGLKLKRAGKKVVFDAHEDLPLQVRNKTYLSPWMRRAAAFALGHFETYACARFDAVVAATPFIRDKFARINAVTVDINNYPVLEELGNDMPYEARDDVICYIGYITEVRGIKQIVRAMEKTENVHLLLAGAFQQKEVEAEVRSYPGWEKVDFLGFLDREGVREVLARSKAGLVTLHPTPNYLDALPVKMFEYMAAGVPVIASDFPLWRKIVETADCGICVDPTDPDAIAAAVKTVLDNPERSAQMGRNGIAAAKSTYNWRAEEAKLLSLYAEMLS